jgi:hypothetical protein
MWGLLIYYTAKIKSEAAELVNRAKILLPEGDWRGAASLYKAAIIKCVDLPDKFAEFLTELKGIYHSNDVTADTDRIAEFPKAYREISESKIILDDKLRLYKELTAEMENYMKSLP